MIAELEKHAARVLGFHEGPRAIHLQCEQLEDNIPRRLNEFFDEQNVVVDTSRSKRIARECATSNVFHLSDRRFESGDSLLKPPHELILALFNP